MSRPWPVARRRVRETCRCHRASAAARAGPAMSSVLVCFDFCRCMVISRHAHTAPVCVSRGARGVEMPPRPRDRNSLAPQSIPLPDTDDAVGWSGQGLARCYEKPRGHKGAGIHHYSHRHSSPPNLFKEGGWPSAAAGVRAVTSPATISSRIHGPSGCPKRPSSRHRQARR